MPAMITPGTPPGMSGIGIPSIDTPWDTWDDFKRAWPAIESAINERHREFPEVYTERWGSASQQIREMMPDVVSEGLSQDEALEKIRAILEENGIRLDAILDGDASGYQGVAQP